MPRLRNHPKTIRAFPSADAMSSGYTKPLFSARRTAAVGAGCVTVLACQRTVSPLGQCAHLTAPTERNSKSQGETLGLHDRIERALKGRVR